MRIEEILARRTDLSTFLVHLTRDSNRGSARENLLSIVADSTVAVGEPRGIAVERMLEKGWDIASQRVVCFTETPLEYIYLLTEDIENREYKFAPYGIAITKRQGRLRRLNPVWYTDITPGSRNWLINSVQKIVDEAIDGERQDHPIFNLTPYVEQFGRGLAADGYSYRKEFSWEREWRSDKDFGMSSLSKYIVICPEREHAWLREQLGEKGWLDMMFYKLKFIDAHWGLEQMIAKLAGFDPEDVGIA